MIPVKFEPLFADIRTYLLANTFGVAVRRIEPAGSQADPSPAKLVVLRVDNGSRQNEVSRAVRVTARIKCPLPAPNQNQPDYDATSALATQVTALLERAPQTITRLQETTESYGPYPVKDDGGFEIQTVFVDYQVRGSSL